MRRPESLNVPGNTANKAPIKAPQPNPEITIFGLLDHLIRSRNMDIYYYLMNEANIISFEKSILTISKASSDKAFDNRLKDIISDLTGLEGKVALSDSSDSKILKKDLIKSFESSSEWQNFSEKVKGSKIVDVVHKEWA